MKEYTLLLLTDEFQEIIINIVREACWPACLPFHSSISQFDGLFYCPHSLSLSSPGSILVSFTLQPVYRPIPSCSFSCVPCVTSSPTPVLSLALVLESETPGTVGTVGEEGDPR